MSSCLLLSPLNSSNLCTLPRSKATFTSSVIFVAMPHFSVLMFYISLFCIAIKKYVKLGNWLKKEVYLAHGSAGCTWSIVLVSALVRISGIFQSRHKVKRNQHVTWQEKEQERQRFQAFLNNQISRELITMVADWGWGGGRGGCWGWQAPSYSWGICSHDLNTSHQASSPILEITFQHAI